MVVRADKGSGPVAVGRGVYSDAKSEQKVKTLKIKHLKTEGEELLILMSDPCNDDTIDSGSFYLPLFVAAPCISAPAVASSCFVVAVSPGLSISPSFSLSPASPTSFLAASALSSKSKGEENQNRIIAILVIQQD